MVVGPIIAIIAAFGSPLATRRERVVEIPTATEPREEITETPQERIGERIDDPDRPLFDPIPSPDFSEISGGGPEDTTEFVVFKDEKAPVEVKEGTGEEFVSGGLVALSIPQTLEETTLDAGQLEVAARTADLLNISLEESVDRLETQLAAQPAFIPPTTTFKFSVGDVTTWKNPHPVRGVQGSHFLITATPATTQKFKTSGEPVYTGRFIGGPWAGNVRDIPESKLE